MVNWNGECSSTFSVGNGVKQGGVLSPVLFTVYLYGLIDQLKIKGIGCHFNGHFVGCLYMLMILLCLHHHVMH